MHVRKLPSGSWRVIVQSDGRKRTATASSKAAAQHRGAELLLELGREPTTPTEISVGELLRVRVEQADLADTTREDYGFVLAKIPDWLSSMPVASVTPAGVAAAYRRLEAEGWSAHRIRRLHTMARPAFDQAALWGWIVSNPLVPVRPPAVPYTELEPPSADEVVRLIDAARERDPDVACALLVLASTGMRRGELCGLRWGDVDVDTGTVVVRRSVAATKGKTSVKASKTGSRGHRPIGLPAGVVAELKGHRRRQLEQAIAAGVRVDDTSPVFAHDFVRPWRPDFVTRSFAKIRTAAGVPGVRLHDLRHFVATELLAAGVDPRTVAGRLGHARTSTTLDIYAAWVPARDRDAADIMGARLTGS
jgi:integrase